MLVLSVLAIVALGVSTFTRLDAGSASILAKADNAICLVFFVDFLVSLYRAPSRTKYFLTWGWLDLLSSIPMVDSLRWGRAARIMRILRVLRGVRSAKILSDFILGRRAQGALLAASLLSILLVVTSSMAILQFETAPEANIKTPEDALWWSIATITTVGYGDRFPTSTEGRLVASFLMVAGVGLFGALSGFVASWFLRPEQEEQESEIQQVLAELKALREAVEARGLRDAT
jgi:voltage-gated potassium channel